jgi:hypothetical protein
VDEQSWRGHRESIWDICERQLGRIWDASGINWEIVGQLVGFGLYLSYVSRMFVFVCIVGDIVGQVCIMSTSFQLCVCAFVCLYTVGYLQIVLNGYVVLNPCISINILSNTFLITLDNCPVQVGRHLGESCGGQLGDCLGEAADKHV